MPDEAEPLVTIDNVSKSFDGNNVLRDVSAVIYPGDVLGLIGRSGAGKSVLINMLRGNPEYRPTSGKVIYRVNQCHSCENLDLPFRGAKCTKCGGETKLLTIDFWSLGENDKLRLALKQRIAIMLQRTFALFGDMSVIENIFEAMGKCKEQEMVDRAIELLKMVNMTHRTTHIARDLSGGEKQRCVLARQLARDPLLFLADEPTGTLDPGTAELVHRTLVEMSKKTKMGMVVTSHWPKAINRLSNKAIWLEAGEMMKRGDPVDVTKEFMVGFAPKDPEPVPIGGPIVRVTDAKKYYYSIVRGVVKAVDGVTFDIKEKEIFGLVGLSGAGKTTLSRMIAGITPGTSGNVEVRIGDDWVSMYDLGEFGRGRATPYIGVLHQEYSLYPFNTVLQNLTNCIGLKMPAEFGKMKAIQVLSGVGFEKKDIEKLLYAYPDTLSVGEKQRVAMATVLIREPRIVILDEPTGTMDPITKISVAKSILTARKELGETFIIVSHDMDFVVNCCDRAAIMKGGKVVAEGEPKQIVGYMTAEEREEMTKSGVEVA
ncbi:MAG TPA: methyl coenzyme M reductase system, component A2 [Methanomassiliicoccales archaeon]|nr:methyl coenzyme M reductase system, component A2 [Methanomassiliicoccales archaeon]